MDEIIKIDLFGEEFKFKPDGQVENSEEIAGHLTKYIADAGELFENKTSGKNKIAILLLAAMNLATDFHELALKQTNLEEMINKRISSLVEKIDTGIE